MKRSAAHPFVSVAGWKPGDKLTDFRGRVDILDRIDRDDATSGPGRSSLVAVRGHLGHYYADVYRLRNGEELSYR